MAGTGGPERRLISEHAATSESGTDTGSSALRPVGDGHERHLACPHGAGATTLQLAWVATT
ncbi:MAG: hypothetical protein AcusKO_26980 [Acuticoccus sp.]